MPLQEIVSQVAPYLRRNKDHVVIDDFCSRAYYKHSTVLLIGFTIILCTSQTFGPRIQCQASGISGLETSMMETHCFITGTFTVRYSRDHSQTTHELKHTNYQWNFPAIILMAFFFYLPHWVWKQVEGQQMRAMCQEHDSGHESWFDHIAERFDKKSATQDNLTTTLYFICQLLNPTLIIAYCYLCNWLLHGHFFFLVPNIYTFMQGKNWETTDQFLLQHPLQVIFPTRVRCDYQAHGASGYLNKTSNVCYLPLNALFDKMFVVLWILFTLLLILSMIQALITLAMIYSPYLRLLVLKRICVNKDLHKEISCLTKKLTFGQWYQLQLLGQNINPFRFSALIEELGSSQAMAV